MVAMIMTNTRREHTGDDSPHFDQFAKMWCGIEKQNKTKKNPVPFAFSSSDFFLASTMSCAYVGFTDGVLFKSDMP